MVQRRSMSEIALAAVALVGLVVALYLLRGCSPYSTVPSSTRARMWAGKMRELSVDLFSTLAKSSLCSMRADRVVWQSKSLT